MFLIVVVYNHKNEFQTTTLNIYFDFINEWVTHTNKLIDNAI